MNKKMTYSQWKKLHKRKMINTIKGYAVGFAAASFPVLLLAHYLIIGY